MDQRTKPRTKEHKELKEAHEQETHLQSQHDKLSYSHQREYVMWINEAKKEATRQSRVMKTIEMLKQGKKAR